MQKKWKILLVSFLGILIIARIISPFFILKYVNKTLDELEGYSGHVKDIDLNLYRGAYVIDSITIQKTGHSIPVPFISIPKTDLSVHWKALFHGAIVGEVIFSEPNINFTVSKDTSKQFGEKADWTETLNKLMPLTINRFEIENGAFHFKDFSKSIDVDIAMDSLHLLATNLSNVKEKDDDLPSTIEASGITSLGGGTLDISTKANILNNPPDIDLNLKLENVNIPDLNEIIHQYIKADFENGTFNLYTEIYTKDGELTGYVKPILENLKVLEWKKEEENIFLKTWEAFLGLVTETTENQPTDRLATKVPIEGTLNNTDVGVLSTIWNVFKNAFIEAFQKDIDNTIYPGKNNDKSIFNNSNKNSKK